jgi:hypothetical protein
MKPQYNQTSLKQAHTHTELLAEYCGLKWKLQALPFILAALPADPVDDDPGMQEDHHARRGNAYAEQRDPPQHAEGPGGDVRGHGVLRSHNCS